MKALIGIIVVMSFWILYLYNRIEELQREKYEIIKDAINQLNKNRKKED